MCCLWHLRLAEVSWFYDKHPAMQRVEEAWGRAGGVSRSMQQASDIANSSLLPLSSSSNERESAPSQSSHSHGPSHFEEYMALSRSEVNPSLLAFASPSPQRSGGEPDYGRSRQPSTVSGIDPSRFSQDASAHSASGAHETDSSGTPSHSKSGGAARHIRSTAYSVAVAPSREITSEFREALRTGLNMPTMDEVLETRQRQARVERPWNANLVSPLPPSLRTLVANCPFNYHDVFRLPLSREYFVDSQGRAIQEKICPACLTPMKYHRAAVRCQDSTEGLRASSVFPNNCARCGILIATHKPKTEFP